MSNNPETESRQGDPHKGGASAGSSSGGTSGGGMFGGDSPGAQSGMIGRIIAGDYRIIREVGRGGMGTVYEAFQMSLQRTVALKILGASIGGSQNAVIRFRREAQAAAKLHHQNIVRIHAQGEDSGLYFYTMDFIEGQSLYDVINEQRGGAFLGGLDATETKVVLGGDSDSARDSDPQQTVAVTDHHDARSASGAASGSATSADRSSSGAAHLSESKVQHYDRIAALIAAAADALQYAHDQGVIHRDIKPHNFLIGQDDNLYITDFGLARVLEQPGVTQTGEFVGSPLYMSFEQIKGTNGPVDHRTDIYSLGATLYEWLTLQPPHPGRSREQVIASIIENEPPPPRTINAEIPVDLETVCLKAIARDPAERYQSAAQMADDLNRFVERGRIRARRDGLFKRFKKLAARNRAATWAIAATFVVAVIATVVSTARERAFQRRKEEQTRRLAQAEDASQRLEAQVNDLAEKNKRLVDAILASKQSPLDVLLPPEIGSLISKIGETEDAEGDAPSSVDSTDAAAPTGANPSASIDEVLDKLEPPPTFGAEDRRLAIGFASELKNDVRAEMERLSQAAVTSDASNATDAPGDQGSSAADPDASTGAEGAPPGSDALLKALDVEDAETSLSLIGEAIKQNDPDVTLSAVYLRAIRHIELERFDDALEDARAFLKLIAPDKPAGYAVTGVALFCVGDAIAAVQEFDRALALAPDHPVVLRLRGLARLFALDYEGALADLTRSSRLAPGALNGIVARGAFHSRRGGFVQALADFRRVLQVEPDHALAQAELEDMWNRVRDMIARCTDIVQDDPGNAVAFEKRGDAYAVLEEYDSALADYKKAMSLSTSLPPGLLAKNILISQRANAKSKKKPKKTGGETDRI